MTEQSAIPWSEYSDRVMNALREAVQDLDLFRADVWIGPDDEWLPNHKGVPFCVLVPKTITPRYLANDAKDVTWIVRALIYTRADQMHRAATGNAEAFGLLKLQGRLHTLNDSTLGGLVDRVLVGPHQGIQRFTRADGGGGIAGNAIARSTTDITIEVWNITRQED